MVKRRVGTFETEEALLLAFKGIAFMNVWVYAALSRPTGLFLVHLCGLTLKLSGQSQLVARSGKYTKNIARLAGGDPLGRMVRHRLRSLHD